MQRDFLTSGAWFCLCPKHENPRRLWVIRRMRIGHANQLNHRISSNHTSLQLITRLILSYILKWKQRLGPNRNQKLKNPKLKNPKLKNPYHQSNLKRMNLKKNRFLWKSTIHMKKVGAVGTLLFWLTTEWALRGKCASGPSYHRNEAGTCWRRHCQTRRYIQFQWVWCGVSRGASHWHQSTEDYQASAALLEGLATLSQNRLIPS